MTRIHHVLHVQFHCKKKKLEKQYTASLKCRRYLQNGWVIQNVLWANRQPYQNVSLWYIIIKNGLPPVIFDYVSLCIQLTSMWWYICMPYSKQEKNCDSLRGWAVSIQQNDTSKALKDVAMPKALYYRLYHAELCFRTW